MTDCYLCGHPILEGQQRTSENILTAAQAKWQHANHADHLPTLDKLPVQTLSERAMRRVSAPYVRDARREERERAANMVKEYTAGHEMSPGLRGEFQLLAERIKSGDRVADPFSG